MKKVAYSKQAIKTLKRIPTTDAQRIRAKISQYAVDPASLSNNVKPLQGVQSNRLRIGDWRVIFDEDDIVIDVIRIVARGEVYKGLDR